MPVTPSAAHGGPGVRTLWATLAALAIAWPVLMAFNLPPSATLLNQAAALLGWGGFVLVLCAGLPAQPGLLRGSRSRGLRLALAALAIVALAALASPLWAGLPWSLALPPAGMIGAAALVMQAAAAAQRAGRGAEAFRAVCVGLLMAGVASSLIGIVQVFAPPWTDGLWIATSISPGRAVGNLRQPNHLASLLLWAIIAALWLGEQRALARRVALSLALLMLFAAVLSASRTGAVGALVLALWGVFDRRLSRGTRLALWAVPLLYVLAWAGMTAWAHAAQQVFVGEAQLHKSDPSSSRFGIWANTIALIRMHPWTGVGFGEFNFAWTLTPFPGRPVAFFDHTHNLPLQFAVELGLPLAALVLALLAAALWQAVRAARDAEVADAAATPLRAALVMVLMAVLHSQLEYPLWYAYFLLPAAFAFGLCSVGARADDAARAAPALPGRAAPLAILGAWLVMWAGFTVYDYAKVKVIFAPPEDAAPLAQRIAEGRRSWFFAHHADYAAATTVEHPSHVMAAFVRAPHYLLDARLMLAWAKALDEAGDTQRARYLAQRLREFRNEQADEFFAPCDDETVAAPDKPFQCQAPTVELGFRNFRP